MKPLVRLFSDSTDAVDLSNFSVNTADCKSIVSPGLDYVECDIAVLYGSKKEYKKAKKSIVSLRNDIFDCHSGPLIVVETGFLGRSFSINTLDRISAMFGRHRRAVSSSPYFRVGLNGAFGDDANFCNSNSSFDRWNAISEEFKLQIRPWRRNGNHVLLVGQVPGDASLRGALMSDWLRDTALEIRQHTDRPITLRLHPTTKRKDSLEIIDNLRSIDKISVSSHARPIVRDFEGAWACVTYSSSSSVEALLTGIPPICLSPANIAYSICSNKISDIEDPLLPKREQWFADLAYAQWNASEMRDGQVWHRLWPELNRLLRHYDYGP